MSPSASPLHVASELSRLHLAPGPSGPFPEVCGHLTCAAILPHCVGSPSPLRGVHHITRLQFDNALPCHLTYCHHRDARCFASPYISSTVPCTRFHFPAASHIRSSTTTLYFLLHHTYTLHLTSVLYYMVVPPLITSPVGSPRCCLPRSFPAISHIHGGATPPYRLLYHTYTQSFTSYVCPTVVAPPIESHIGPLRCT